MAYARFLRAAWRMRSVSAAWWVLRYERAEAKGRDA